MTSLILLDPSLTLCTYHAKFQTFSFSDKSMQTLLFHGEGSVDSRNLSLNCKMRVRVSVWEGASVCMEIYGARGGVARRQLAKDIWRPYPFRVMPRSQSLIDAKCRKRH